MNMNKIRKLTGKGRQVKKSTLNGHKNVGYKQKCHLLLLRPAGTIV